MENQLNTVSCTYVSIQQLPETFTSKWQAHYLIKVHTCMHSPPDSSNGGAIKSVGLQFMWVVVFFKSIVHCYSPDFSLGWGETSLSPSLSLLLIRFLSIIFACGSEIQNTYIFWWLLFHHQTECKKGNCYNADK